jgi:hypothetical protein
MSYGKPGEGFGPPGGFQPGPGQFAPPQKSGGSATLVIVLVVGGVLALCCVGFGVVGVALLLPAMQAARAAAQQSGNSMNLKQIGIALHNYHDTHMTLPPAFIADASGQPRTSWRALLLPYVNPAFGNYNFNVAWNAPENDAIRQTMIPEYADFRDRESGGAKTAFVAITGQGTAFEGAKGSRFSDLVDGLSNTILIVQIKNSDIDWAEPRDLDINALTDDPNAPNTIDLQGGAIALAADGAIARLSKNVTLQMLKDYITIRDGKVVQPLY